MPGTFLTQSPRSSCIKGICIRVIVLNFEEMKGIITFPLTRNGTKIPRERYQGILSKLKENT